MKNQQNYINKDSRQIRCFCILCLLSRVVGLLKEVERFIKEVEKRGVCKGRFQRQLSTCGEEDRGHSALCRRLTFASRYTS